MPHNNRLLPWNIKKKRGSQDYCLSRTLGSRIAHLPRINNADAHASDILIKVYTKTWTSNIVLQSDRLEFARFKAVADKTSVQRLSIMSAASFQGNNEANLGIIRLLQPKNHPKKEKRMVFAVFQDKYLGKRSSSTHFFWCSISILVPPSAATSLPRWDFGLTVALYSVPVSKAIIYVILHVSLFFVCLAGFFPIRMARWGFQAAHHQAPAWTPPP